MYNALKLMLWMICSYIIGSIPFSYAIPKLFKGLDIREHGSKNVGTTNVFRVLGARYAIPALVLDVFKGGIVMYLAQFRFKPETALIIAMIAVVGHCYSFMLGFKGGKGVATAGGIVIVKSLPLAGILLLIIVGTVALTRYVSLGSILAALSLPFSYYLLYRDMATSLIFACLALFVVFQHRSNIARLLKGKENKMNFKRK